MYMDPNHWITEKVALRLIGRVRDTLRTLFGRSEVQIEMARMRADWLSMWGDVADMLGKLSTAKATEARRMARAETKKQTSEPQADLPPSPQTVPVGIPRFHSNKDRARAKLAALKAGPGRVYNPKTDKVIEHEPSDQSSEVSG